MKKMTGLVLIAMCSLGMAAHAQAPGWSSTQQEVWALVEQSWVDDVAENGKWPAAYVHDNYSAWADDTAAPRGKDSSIGWSRFADENSNTLKYEVSPEAIAIAGDTAVVHYNVTLVTENHEGKRSNSVGRITEVLIREGRNWKWLGGVSYEPRLND